MAVVRTAPTRLLPFWFLLCGLLAACGGEPCATGPTCYGHAHGLADTAGGEAQRGVEERGKRIAALLDRACELGHEQACREVIPYWVLRSEPSGSRRAVASFGRQEPAFVRTEPHEAEAAAESLQRAYLRLRELAFERAAEQDTVESYDAFLVEFPQAPQAQVARVASLTLQSRALLEQARADGDFSAAMDFEIEHHAVVSVRSELCQGLVGSSDLPSVSRYLELYPPEDGEPSPPDSGCTSNAVRTHHRDLRVATLTQRTYPTDCGDGGALCLAQAELREILRLRSDFPEQPIDSFVERLVREYLDSPSTPPLTPDSRLALLIALYRPLRGSPHGERMARLAYTDATASIPAQECQTGFSSQGDAPQSRAFDRLLSLDGFLTQFGESAVASEAVESRRVCAKAYVLASISEPEGIAHALQQLSGRTVIANTSRNQRHDARRAELSWLLTSVDDRVHLARAIARAIQQQSSDIEISVFSDYAAIFAGLPEVGAVAQARTRREAADAREAARQEAEDERLARQEEASERRNHPVRQASTIGFRCVYPDGSSTCLCSTNHNEVRRFLCFQRGQCSPCR